MSSVQDHSNSLQAGANGTSHSAPVSILVVDDSLTLRQFIDATLTGNFPSYRVLLAKNGAQAIDLAVEHRPQLILLDFVLPDFNANEVCRRLLEETSTAAIPVILMSSSVADMKRTQELFRNVKHSLAKPLTPELICASVASALKNASQTRNTVQAEARRLVSTSIFSGDTSYFPLCEAFRVIERDALSGILTLDDGMVAVQQYWSRGHLLLSSCFDPQHYLQCAPKGFEGTQHSQFEAALNEQKESGCPVFISLLKSGSIDIAAAERLVYETGFRLLESAWSTQKVIFQFQLNADLPPFCNLVQARPDNALEWAMDSLRRFGDRILPSFSWPDLTGIPCYTRNGYDRIRNISLFNHEIEFAIRVNSISSLQAIMEDLGLEPSSVQQVFYRFVQMQIMEYWPADLIQPVSTSDN